MPKKPKRGSTSLYKKVKKMKEEKYVHRQEQWPPHK
jgi:hypothetical protein